MKKLPHFLFALLAVLVMSWLSGCVTRLPQAQYDFGPLRALPLDKPAALPPVRIADVDAPTWLSGNQMSFRLAYANEQQVRPYAANQWNMPPAQLFGQRLKARIAEAGGVVLSATGGASQLPLVRIEMDDFIQIFDNETSSWTRIAVRASIFDGRTLLAQKTFVRDWPAPTPDAAGGARALADASDAVIGELMLWLAAQPLKR
ncbi:MAG: ABC-type transport auxiliary lipoprotein family protein [Burkholderiaceae bacterium]|nr:ABC-type transport auxiliary lipoprotein family protein [Burkholderiaceae bacterium]